MARFKKGQSGNPKGRPKGVVDRRSRYLGLIEQQIPDVVDQVVSAALGGDITACKLLLDKVLPNVRSQTETINLPAGGGTVVDRADAITKELLTGTLSPEQAGAAMSVIVDGARLREHAEFEARLEALEQAKGRSSIAT